MNTKPHNGSIYLSGGMQHAVDIGAGWRQELSQELRALNFKPIDIAWLDKEYSNRYGELYRGLDEEDLLRKANLRYHYVVTDIELIRQNSDALIVLYDESVRRGAGTISEIHDAYMQGKPIFIINGFEKFSDVPGWMQAESTKIFPSMKGLLEYFKMLPEGILRLDQYGNHRSGTMYLCSLCGNVEEKNDTYFVSKVTPTYCKRCVSVVKQSVDQLPNRYALFRQLLEENDNHTFAV